MLSFNLARARGKLKEWGLAVLLTVCCWIRLVPILAGVGEVKCREPVGCKLRAGRGPQSGSGGGRSAARRHLIPGPRGREATRGTASRHSPPGNYPGSPQVSYTLKGPSGGYYVIAWLDHGSVGLSHALLVVRLWGRGLRVYYGRTEAVVLPASGRPGPRSSLTRGPWQKAANSGDTLCQNSPQLKYRGCHIQWTIWGKTAAMWKIYWFISFMLNLKLIILTIERIEDYNWFIPKLFLCVKSTNIWIVKSALIALPVQRLL